MAPAARTQGTDDGPVAEKTSDLLSTDSKTCVYFAAPTSPVFLQRRF